MYGCSILRTVRLYEHLFPQLVWIIEVQLYMVKCLIGQIKSYIPFMNEKIFKLCYKGAKISGIFVI